MRGGRRREAGDRPGVRRGPQHRRGRWGRGRGRTWTGTRFCIRTRGQLSDWYKVMRRKEEAGERPCVRRGPRRRRGRWGRGRGRTWTGARFCIRTRGQLSDWEHCRENKRGDSWKTICVTREAAPQGSSTHRPPPSRSPPLFSHPPPFMLPPTYGSPGPLALTRALSPQPCNPKPVIRVMQS